MRHFGIGYIYTYCLHLCNYPPISASATKGFIRFKLWTYFHHLKEMFH